MAQQRHKEKVSMKTIFAVLFLVICGAIANFLTVIILNIAGLPGALVAGMPGRRNKKRFVFGSIISAIGQSYINLAYVAFVVSWTKLAAARDDVLGFVIWPFAFLAVFVPIWHNLIIARVEAREMEHASAQTEALHLTVLATLLGFFVLTFVPTLTRMAWCWIPFVSK